MRKLFITDIHGAYKALVQVLERCKFNPKEDQLIFGGDVCDGWREVTECIQLLSSFPNLVSLIGNHDFWTKVWLGAEMKIKPSGLHFDEHRCWVEQGGQATINSIVINNSYQLFWNFFSSMKSYHVDNNRLFIHGGIDPNTKAEDNTFDHMIWDRMMIKQAYAENIHSDLTVKYYSEVFCGHTPVQYFNKTIPTKFNNIWACDTGASYNGPLSIIDIDTKYFWQSDPVINLYPGEKAR